MQPFAAKHEEGKAAIESGLLISHSLDSLLRSGSTELQPIFRLRILRQKALVPMRRIELPTSPLPRECSTTELHGHFGAS